YLPLRSVARQVAGIDLAGLVELALGEGGDALAARLLHGERVARYRLGIDSSGSERGERRRHGDGGLHGSCAFIQSSFFSSRFTISAVSGRYLPSRMTASCPSLLKMKRRNSRTLGSTAPVFGSTSQNP